MSGSDPQTQVAAMAQVDYGEIEYLPLFQLAHKSQGEEILEMMESPLFVMIELKNYFDRLADDSLSKYQKFLFNELSFYLQLSALRPRPEQWENLLRSLPKGTDSLWQSWLRRQIILLLEIDEDLLKAVYYYYARYLKRGYPLTIRHLLAVYGDLQAQGHFVLSDFRKVVERFDTLVKQTFAPADLTA
jgi:hypothetical protein